ncbi:iron ABC transporter permease [Flavobacterium salilacus subsp. salilacus]|uniref:FecCD family ABC transporter permease n=1 Tax=Flavobacterium TaxID=237 RepID=UPI001075379D|nr:MULTISPECIES: iron ABC transporter permease [Flavobacterium]KAF2519053.1 iron ABC transporter permease [Flavobacterium salilacus subsp. salilacus]MBE1614782.1 iron ABC transporter permease [Flavobacterium sp. SaA2.13]
MQNRLSLYMFSSILLLMLLAAVSLYMGVYVFEKYSFAELIKGVIANDNTISDSDRFVIMGLRLPRISMAILIGSGLAVSGTCLQGMFKNPLATPDLIGITSGASLFAALAIVLGSAIKPYIPEVLHFSLLSIMAFLGALLTMMLVYRISTTNGKTNVIIMLLSGVAITALGFSITGFLIYISKEEQLRDLTFWNLGSLAAATWTKNAILAVIITISYIFLINKGKALNAMMLGERDAQHLGIPVERIKKQIVLFTALMVGTSVAFAGTISFVGLIVPYILRLIFKSNYHIILPLSAILGSVLLLAADTISRTIAAPAEVPIGILTAFMGAPIFIAILIRNRKSM